MKFSSPTTIPSCMFVRTEVVGDVGGSAYVANEDGKWSRLFTSAFLVSAPQPFGMKGVISFVNKETGLVVATQSYPVTIATIESLSLVSSSATWDTISYRVHGGVPAYKADVVIPVDLPVIGFETPILSDVSLSKSGMDVHATHVVGMPGYYRVKVRTEYELDGVLYSDDSLEFDILVPSE